METENISSAESKGAVHFICAMKSEKERPPIQDRNTAVIVNITTTPRFDPVQFPDGTCMHLIQLIQVQIILKYSLGRGPSSSGDIRLVVGLLWSPINKDLKILTSKSLTLNPAA